MESKRVEEDYKALVASNTWSTVYKSIKQRCHSYRYTCVEAKKAENKPLNRYRDVNPYDHSRIVLRREGFDYINANLVKVERANRQYILTQGPLVYTSGHFWLMIWEQKCPAIIMLNKVIENLEVKCHWYWPHEKGERTDKQIPYADVNMTVSQVSELDCNYYTIRKLRVTNHDTEESRDIWQFHYTTWPDFGVPESPHAFLVFLKHVNDYKALDGTEGPAVVHCSAGIGRSGTFCLVDSVLVMIENEGQANVDVQEVLLEMRRYRMGLIQTSEQFRFSYKAIIEGIKRMDPEYVPFDLVPEPEQAVPRQEEETPPPPPPRGESLGQPPARPLPKIPASASMGSPFPATNAPSSLASVVNISSEQSEGVPTPSTVTATSARIMPLVVPPSILPPLSMMVVNSVVAHPINVFIPAEEMDLIEFLPIALLPERSPTPTIIENSDSHSSTSYEDPPLLNSNDDFYISSEDLVTYETSGAYANDDMMDIDPPANHGRQGHNLCELSSSVDSDGSDTPPTPPPRPRHANPGTPPTESSYEELDEDDDEITSLDNAEEDVGSGESPGVRRRRNAAFAKRIDDMKKRSRKADRWKSVKDSIVKPLAISVGVGLLAVAGVLIYNYIHRH